MLKHQQIIANPTRVCEILWLCRWADQSLGKSPPIIKHQINLLLSSSSIILIIHHPHRTSFQFFFKSFKGCLGETNRIFFKKIPSGIGHVSWLLSLMSSATISDFRQPVQLRSLTFNKSTLKCYLLYFSSNLLYFSSNLSYFSSKHILCS